LDRGHAQDLRVTERDQRRTLGMARHTGLDGDGPQVSGLATVGPRSRTRHGVGDGAGVVSASAGGGAATTLRRKRRGRVRSTWPPRVAAGSPLTRILTRVVSATFWRTVSTSEATMISSSSEP